jgi:hypothetical protein
VRRVEEHWPQAASWRELDKVRRHERYGPWIQEVCERLDRPVAVPRSSPQTIIHGPRVLGILTGGGKHSELQRSIKPLVKILDFRNAGGSFSSLKR